MNPIQRLREAASGTASPELLREEADDPNGNGIDTDADSASDNGDESSKPCPTCNGTAVVDGKRCTTCNGSGTVKAMSEADDAKTKSCPTCKGSGKIAGGLPCKSCKGTGKVPADWKAPAKGDSGPPWLKGKESATIEERLEALETSFIGLREAKPDFLNQQFSPMTQVTNSAGEKGYAVVLIREGLGNQEDANWYTAAGIKDMCESGRAEGMQAYANHPDLEEEETRPERDVRHLIGKHTDVTFAEAGGKAQAKAVFVPITTNEMHPTYGWVTTLAEAAVHNHGPQPLVGWSLYGLSGGDEGTRPDGSEGRMVDLIMPTSGDMVTNAGAGGEFAHRLMMESARRLRRATTTPKEEPAMKIDQFNTQFAEATKHLREADTDEKRTAALAEFDVLTEAKLDAPATTPGSIEALEEAAPGLVQRIREAATQAVAKDKGDVEAQRDAAQTALKEAQATLSQFTDVMSIDGTLREAGVVDDKERRYFISQARSRNLHEADDIKDLVETEREYHKSQEDKLLAAMRESFDMPEVEGNGGRLPEAQADGGAAALREAGIPTKEAAAA